MNILSQFLEDREQGRVDQAAADERWLSERGGVDAGERLQAWDRWVLDQLGKLLTWPADPAARQRLMRQSATEITGMVKQLYGRGWLLDGKALATHVQAVLKPIGEAQRAGKVGDFWPYLRASVRRYVGANAEEIQGQARRTGADVGAATLGAILGALPALQRGPSMTELIAGRAAEVGTAKGETLRQQQARVRARETAERAKQAEVGRQMGLF